MSDSKIDVAAISLSGLCILHCLALPIIVTILPVLSSVAEAEWLHKLFVVLAIPLALYAFFNTSNKKVGIVFAFLAFLGVTLLVAGAFVEAFHDYETPMTVIGALLLSIAHIYRWRTHTKPHAA